MSVTAPHSQMPLPSGSPFIGSSPSPRQYQSPTSVDPPRTQSTTRPAGSPHASRRPSRKQSGNNSKVGPIDQAASPRSASSTPRVLEFPRPSTASPAAAGTAVSSAPSPAISHSQTKDHRDQSAGPPFAPPPRTSSHPKHQASEAPASTTLPDRTLPARLPPSDPNASRQITTAGAAPEHHRRDKGPGDGQVDRPAEEHSRGTTATATGSGDAKQKTSGSVSVPQQAKSPRDPRSRQSPSTTKHRSAPQGGNPVPPGSQEDTHVVNRVVVTDPAIDLAREQERLSEAVPVSSVPDGDTPRSNTQRRQDYSGSVSSAGRRKETKFGEYILGQTLGEGEFGKVKLGWKKDGSVQVAIKLIRLEALGTNPNRLPKIYREISILRDLSHPNIVRLHEMVETKSYIGIILEYASGGELFDYILNQRYLKDNSARRLFAQLVSGVGYLHKKGIVHRDLKLENLLLDRNRNIIITDFGFANTFNPNDELGDEIEWNLANRDYVKRRGLDQVSAAGGRRGDLMQTSCGSPCYAAPELVVTDSLYTGRKVDVWSCGVILYAMLAGYLPFDDDPANPEGDNINLLYKYIVSTPLTFPEYVTPHARDLLRRILVPDPRKRADLFEVARHSWLSDYAHVVAHVTSSTTTAREVATAAVASERTDAPLLARSASVREPTKPVPSSLSPVGGLSHQGKLGPDDISEKTRSSTRDPKRRTVQVEYVAPQSQTVRGESTSNAASPVAYDSKSTPFQTAAYSGGPAGNEEVGARKSSLAASSAKPLPQDPPSSQQHRRSTQVPQDSRAPKAGQAMAPPVRPPKDMPRSASDSTGAFAAAPSSYSVRPATGGSMTMTNAGRMPSRGNSYSQPLAPALAATNAQGRLSQPKNGKHYNVPAPVSHAEPSSGEPAIARPTTQQYPQAAVPAERDTRGHKRSNTLGNVFVRSASIFGRSQLRQDEGNKLEKRYPPTSMKGPMAYDSPRQSTDSRRSSFGFGRKPSDLRKSSGDPKPEKNRRFSLLPASFSLKGLTGSTKDLEGTLPVTERRPSTMQPTSASRGGSRPQTTNFSRGPSHAVGDPYGPASYDGHKDGSRAFHASSNGAIDGRPRDLDDAYPDRHGPPGLAPSQPGHSYYLDEAGTPDDSEADLGVPQQRPLYPVGFNSADDDHPPTSYPSRGGRGVLQKNNRKFADAYDKEQQGHHGGSSGAARRVMDFFRRRGKARAEDDRV